MRDGNAETHPRQRARVEHGPEGLELVVHGAVQSVEVGASPPRGYWPALIPDRRPATALILGIGGGTAAHLLHQRWEGVEITGVDDDPDVLALARSHFGLGSAPLTVVEADARDYVRAARGRFDLVIVDLYRGEAAADFVSSTNFVRRVRQLVKPGGVAVWNLQRDRRGERLRRVAGRGMLLDRRVLAGLNLVLHFRRRNRVLHLSLPAQ